MSNVWKLFPSSAITKERKPALRGTGAPLKSLAAAPVLNEGRLLDAKIGGKLCSPATPLSAHSVQKGIQLLDGFKSARHCYAWDTVPDSCLPPSLLALFEYCG